MTEDERFLFDLTGFLVRPAILSGDEVAEMVDQIERIVDRPDSLPAEQRAAPGGALAALIDHPRIVDVLQGVIGDHVRLNSATLVYRRAGEGHHLGLHQGGAITADPVLGYRAQGEKIFAGMVRVVIELTDVTESDGATTFLPGSHKANFAIPESMRSIDPAQRSPFAMSYACPAGSAVFFTEQLAHGGPVWQRPEPRIAVLHAYTHVAINHHLCHIPEAVIKGLSRERQAYFREPWLVDWRDPATDGVINSVERFAAGADAPLSFERP